MVTCSSIKQSPVAATFAVAVGAVWERRYKTCGYRDWKYLHVKTMMATERMNPDVFREYANLYDLFYQSKDYRKESAYILRVLKRHLRRTPRSILDLGCGTGEHALRWAAKGITVTGIDRSADMLIQAKSKAGRQYPDLRFVKADIRHFNLGKTFDAATAMFAVMSYQTTRNDILSTLRSVRRHLRPGGIFVFDAWFGPGVLADPPGERVKTYRQNGAEVLRTVRSEHDPARKTVHVYYDIVIIKRDRLLQRIKETHPMRYFFPVGIEELASRADFRLVNCHPFLAEKKKLTSADWNATFVLQVCRTR